MKVLQTGLALVLASTPVLAEGDAANGETQFNRQCVACHVVQNPEGETLAGRNGRTGPNLFGIAGDAPGDVEGFDFSDGMLAWGQTGAVWDETNFVGFVTNPTGYLREVTGDARARAKMAYQVRDEQQARDIFAYLSTFGAD